MISQGQGLLSSLAVTLRDVNFTANVSPIGSYLAVPGSGLVLIDAARVIASFNAAEQDAGALLSDNVTSTWDSCVWANNSAAGGFGAALYLERMGSAAVTNSLFAGNFAVRGGVVRGPAPHRQHSAAVG